MAQETVVPADGGLQDRQKEDMFQLAMNGRWDQLVEMYRGNPQAQYAKITSAEDTILHIAVTDDETETVKLLVAAVEDVKVLEIENDIGNTPLHLAAASGKVAMCKCMVEKRRDLLAIRNKFGETPLFLAALHGKKNAFLYLHSECPKDHGSNYWRRKDGNNVLHAAILGEYFDLAFQIIKRYTRLENPALDLVNFRNERGQSALHLLANNPSAFRSGSHLGRLERIIYHCILVDLLEETPENCCEDESESNRKIKLPDNYTTFSDLCALLQRLFRFSLGVPEWLWSLQCLFRQGDQANPQNPRSGLTVFQRLWLSCQPAHNQRDEEDQHDTRSASANGSSDGSRSNRSEGQSRDNNEYPFPRNYVTCYDFFELALVMLQVLGFGFIRTYRVKEKKQKHVWAFQIMEELVSQASSWKYNATGSKPQDGEFGDGEFRWSIVDGTDTGTTLPSTDDRKEGNGEKMTALLQKLLNIFPTSEDELMREGKNVVVIKMENTQRHVHRLLMEMTKEYTDDAAKKETAILVAARQGVKEIVEKILEKFPVAIRDIDGDGKNAVLLAVENRQHHVYKLLLENKYASKDSIFQQVDKQGNSALHLAATLSPNKPWIIPGAALQMQWEIKWYKFVKDSMPRHFFARLNNKGQTSKEVFSETHKDLVQDGGVWLTNTSQSCSVVAALIATVAFATATTVPGGVRESTGKPILEGLPAFEIFAITSLVALCFSVTSLTMFLSILTSRYQESDFHVSLPTKLIIGLSALFVSIASILVSFCAGNFFVLEDQLKYAAFYVYAVTCLPITLFAAAQFPLYLDLIRSSLTSVPRRTYEVTSL